MFKITGITLLIFLVSLYIFSCTRMTEPEQNADGEVDFLLIAESDPIELESSNSETTRDQAFLIDGYGPLFFWVLNLTDEQKAQIREITRSHRKPCFGMREKWRTNEISWEDIQAKRDSIRQVIFEKIFQILTPEQQATVQEIQEQLANGEYPTAVIEKRVEYLTAELGLSESQQNQISVWMAEYGAQILAARQSSSSKYEFHEAKHAILVELDEKMLSILDDDQMAKYLELKEKRNECHRHRHHKFGG
jgi:Spy/CpxP family protein refolding chaperone